jgi:fructose-bisphosphate aldolase, class I
MTAIALTAADLVLDGRGLLAADESGPAMDARLRRAGVFPGAETRRAYREMLVTTPGLSLGISGVVLGDETFRQRLADGRSFPGALADRGLLPGIRIDTGSTPLAGAPGETVTEGLDGLRARLAEYAALGARFATWRAVLRTGDGRPSWRALRANAYAVARYARVCQQAGIVPVAEVVTLGTAGGPETTSAALLVTITELLDMGVDLDGVVVKANMVLPGPELTSPGGPELASPGGPELALRDGLEVALQDGPELALRDGPELALRDGPELALRDGPELALRDGLEVASPEVVARLTVAALRCVVPEEVAGVAFLAGGQSPARATSSLAALRRLNPPWPITFSFGQALADPALAAWHGDPACVAAGQRALANRVACNVAALQGSYTPVLETSYILA